MQGTRGPHLALQAMHHPGEQPCFLALLRVGDEEIYVVASQLPPERDGLPLWSQHGALYFSVTGQVTSVSAAEVLAPGRSLGDSLKVWWALLPPETAGQCDSGTREGLYHSCLHQPLQGLGLSLPNRGAQVLIVLQPCFLLLGQFLWLLSELI